MLAQVDTGWSGCQDDCQDPDSHLSRVSGCECWEFPGTADMPPPAAAGSITLLSPSSRACLSCVLCPVCLGWALHQAKVPAWWPQWTEPLAVPWRRHPSWWHCPGGGAWCPACPGSQGSPPESQVHEIGWDARRRAVGVLKERAGGDGAGAQGWP